MELGVIHLILFARIADDESITRKHCRKKNNKHQQWKPKEPIYGNPDRSRDIEKCTDT